MPSGPRTDTKNAQYVLYDSASLEVVEIATSPDMLLFILCYKKILAIRRMNIPYAIGK
jgi:hypothetical protein